jgi:ABC-type Fe3+/spermidine/putrescine transport system ATPase subunit
VALARALALNPDVLLLDEPLSNLDAKIRGSVRAEIRKLQQALRITTVYVTHDQEEALTLSDRIGIMREGQLVQIGTPHDLYERPATRFVADFIGANNLVAGTVKATGDDILVQTELGLFRGYTHSELKAGDKCTVAFRPENVEVTTEPPSPEDNGIEGKISFASYMGSTLRYEMEHPAGFLLKADIKNPLHHEELGWGSDVYFCFPKSAALVIAD